MLQFVFGKAASGKTTYLHNLIKKDIDSGVKDIVLLVPEQYSFETEKQMLSLFGSGFMSMLEVLSFTRFCETAGRLYGDVAGIRITDAERVILMGRSIKKLSSSLVYFKKNCNSSVFVKQVVSTVNEFKISGVSAEGLLNIAEKTENNMLSLKLKELSAIYSEYNNFIKDVYIDPMDELEIFYKKALKYNYFKNKTIYIDAFKGFTGEQLKILELMLTDAKKVVISFCCDNEFDNSFGNGVFSNIKHTADRLISYAKNNFVELCPNVYLKESYYASNTLKNLEMHLTGDLKYPVTSSSNELVIGNFNTPLQELECVFKTIHRMVRTEDYRYGDFVVIARDISKYERKLEIVSRKYEVPVYFDKRKTLTASPLVRFIVALLNASVNYETADIFSMLKSGFFDLKLEDISLLEDYVFMWDINKSAWLKEWNMNPSGFVANDKSSALTKSDDELLLKINMLRKKVVLPLVNINKALKGNVKTVSEALYNALIELKADEALKKCCAELYKTGNLETSDFVMESWDFVMSVLDSMVRCFNEESLTPTEYTETLMLAFESVTIGSIPVMVDEVSFGSADRIRPARPKVVFVIGLNQGEFPLVASEGGLLLRSDRIALESFGVEISDRFRRFAIDEKFLAYTSLCCASQKVFAFSHSFDFGGAATEKSSIMLGIENAFPNAVKINTLSEELPETYKEAVALLSENYFKNSAFTSALKECIAGNADYADKIQSFEKVVFNAKRRISPKNAGKLFDKEIYLSASKIENYNKCAFSYFCGYVLNIKRLQKAELNNLQRGTIVHFVMERVLKKLGKKIALVSEKEIGLLVEDFMREYILSITGSEFLSGKRFAFLYGEISKMIKFILIHISKEFANSDFEPIEFELNISDTKGIPALKITFSGDKTAVITGQIDRVDVWHTNNDYVRVVDYKTGKKEFYLSDVVMGINLQMLLYLYALKKNSGEKFNNFSPAGILYMPSNRGMTDETGKDSLVMNGMLINNDKVITAMDKDGLGCFIPKKPLRERAANPVIDENDLNIVFDYVDYVVSKTAEKITNGIFDINPLNPAGGTACEYCDFSAVCGLEEDYCIPTVKKAGVKESVLKMREVISGENKLD